MSASRALISTELAGRYMAQLCAHFAHKLPVTRDDAKGAIAFPTGLCRLEADNAELRLDLAAENDGDLATLQDVMSRHLLRFAFRSPVEIEWQNAT